MSVSMSKGGITPITARCWRCSSPMSWVELALVDDPTMPYCGPCEAVMSYRVTRCLPDGTKGTDGPDQRAAVHVRAVSA